MTCNYIILSSSSAIRKRILQQYDIRFRSTRHFCHEKNVFSAHSKLSPEKISFLIAKEKAISVEKKYYGKYILSCDQILFCQERFFFKSPNKNHLIEKLLYLQNKTHYLFCTTLLLHNSVVVWSDTSVSRMVMRALSREDILAYLMKEKKAFSSVGGYLYEGKGIQLFRMVYGDFYCILGINIIALGNVIKDKYSSFLLS